MNTLLFEQLGWKSKDVEALQEYVESEGKINLQSSHPLYAVIRSFTESGQKILWKRTEENNDNPSHDPIS